jgi:diguanylate cyclase (GGDEF)-like protein
LKSQQQSRYEYIDSDFQDHAREGTGGPVTISPFPAKTSNLRKIGRSTNGFVLHGPGKIRTTILCYNETVFEGGRAACPRHADLKYAQKRRRYQRCDALQAPGNGERCVVRLPSKVIFMTRLEDMIIEYFLALDKWGKKFTFIVGSISTIVIGTLDVSAPDEYTFSFLYLIPITFTTWFNGKRAGLFFSVVCTVLWSLDHLKADLFATAWNILSTLGMFCVVTLMLASIRKMWESEIALSRTDPLTGVMNKRAFAEMVEYEIASLQRQSSPYSIAYLDLDNFKEVNDTYGHKQGDELLKAVVSCLVRNVRETDLIARMGGDEFTIFFPATDKHAARFVIQRVKEHLLVLSDSHNWPITFSMGVLTCSTGNCSLDEIVSTADRLMYEVKSAGKNDVRFAEYGQST